MMKHKVCFRLLLFFNILLYFTSANAGIVHSLHFTESDFILQEKSDGKVFITSDIQECSYLNSPTLCLPFITKAYAIPYGSYAKSINITKSEKRLIKSNLELSPNPDQITISLHSICDPKVEEYDFNDTSIYNNLINTSFWHGIPIANIQLSPFEYNPESKELFFIDDLEIDIELSEYPLEVVLNRDAKEIQSEVCQLVSNPEDVHDIIGQIPEYCDNNSKKIDYLLITSRELLESFKPLLEWKKKKGLITEVLPIEDILCREQGRDLQEKIKYCIYDAYLSCGLKYVLLGGDDTIVPVRYCKTRASEIDPERIYPTDLYYASFDNNITWDMNENGVYGESTEKIAPIMNVYLTRLPIRTKEDVDNYITKLLAYEKGYNSKNWDLNILQTGARIATTNKKNKSPEERIKSDSECHADIIYERYIKPYWNGKRTKFFDTYSDFPGGSDYAFHPENLQSQLSKGPMFVSVSTHGDFKRWTMEDFIVFHEEGDSIKNYQWEFAYERDLASELISPNYSLITTIACQTNIFDEVASGVNGVATDPCLSEAFIRGRNNGVIGYLGSSRNGHDTTDLSTLGPSDKFEAFFYRNLFNSKSLKKNFGHIVGLMKTEPILQYYNYIAFPLNPIGDPEMAIYTQIPEEFSDICLYIHEGYFYITTDFEDTTISLTCKEENKPIIFNGTLQFDIRELPDSFSVCITKQNFKPTVYLINRKGDSQAFDIFQEVPQKEGMEYIYRGNLWENMYKPVNINSNDMLPYLSNASYYSGTLNIKIDGNINSDNYQITIKDIEDNQHHTIQLTEGVSNYSVSGLPNGFYIVSLFKGAKLIDSMKYLAK